MESNLKTQIGGDHYKKMSIQPVELITELSLNFIQGNMLKYVCRYENKNGKQDLLKVIHYANLGCELSPRNYYFEDTDQNLGLTKIHNFCKVNQLPFIIDEIICAIVAQRWTLITILINKLITVKYGTV